MKVSWDWIKNLVNNILYSSTIDNLWNLQVNNNVGYDFRPSQKKIWYPWSVLNISLHLLTGVENAMSWNAPTIFPRGNWRRIEMWEGERSKNGKSVFEDLPIPNLLPSFQSYIQSISWPTWERKEMSWRRCWRRTRRLTFPNSAAGTLSPASSQPSLNAFWTSRIFPCFSHKICRPFNFKS